MPNGRCKVHGGKSTGPRTPEGLQRSRRANWKHERLTGVPKWRLHDLRRTAATHMAELGVLPHITGWLHEIKLERCTRAHPLEDRLLA